MQTLKTPLSSKVYKNVNEIQISDQSALLVDGYLDETQGTVKRPGLELAVDLGLGDNVGIDGIYYWTHKQKLVAVAGGKPYFITYDSGSGIYTTATIASADTLASDVKVTFATNGTYLFMANGGRILYTDGTATLQYIADAQCPTTVSHVAFLDGYILANSASAGDTQKFFFSDPVDPLLWDALDFASAVGDGDKLSAIHVFNREIHLFGPKSTEVWENDGQSPFSRLPNGFYSIGCIAPNSIINTRASIIWLDDTRHFVEVTSGGGVEFLESGYEKEIQGFGVVADCTSDRIEINGKPFLVFHFPTENKTLAYDYRQKEWAEWRKYISASSYDRWYGNCYAYSGDWGQHLVGARHNSLIYRMSPDYLSDAGETIRMYRRTGHLDYGTSKNKKVTELRLRAKRGGNEIVGGGSMMLRWKDDNKSWSNEVSIGLGDTGDAEIVTRIFPMGIYRTRQYEVSVSDNVAAIYLDAEEDIEVLSR